MYKVLLVCACLGLAGCSAKESAQSASEMEQLQRTFETQPAAEFWTLAPVKSALNSAVGGKTDEFLSRMEVTTPVKTNGSLLYVMGWKSQAPGESALFVLDLDSREAYTWWSSKSEVFQKPSKPPYLLPFQAQAFIDSWELRKNSPPMSELSTTTAPAETAAK